MRNPLPTVFCLISLLFTPGSSDLIKIMDEFDDGSIYTNTKGTGHGWNKGIWKQARILEQNGALEIPVSNEQANGYIQNKKEDNFPIWTSQGATVTWVIKGITVQTPHYWDMYLAYDWDFGIVTTKGTNNEVLTYPTVCTTGGFWIEFGKKDSSSDTRMSIIVTNKTRVPSEDDPTGKVTVSSFNFNAVYPIICSATLKTSGWSVSLNQDVGGAKLSGNWTTDCQKNGRDASITDEFNDSVYVMAFGRNQGITGSMGDQSYPTNTGWLERIQVKLIGVTGPLIRQKSPGFVWSAAPPARGTWFDVRGAAFQAGLNSNQAPFGGIIFRKDAQGRLSKSVRMAGER